MNYSRVVIAEAEKLKPADVEKYVCRELAIKAWIEDILSIKIGDSLGKALQNGIILCYLSSEIHPGSIPAIHEETKHFYLYKENLMFFIGELEDLGMIKREIFRIEDIMELACIPRVVFCLEKYIEIAEKKGFTVKVKPRPLKEFEEEAAGIVKGMSPKEITELKRAMTMGRPLATKVSENASIKVSPLVIKKQIAIALGGVNAGKSKIIIIIILFACLLIYFCLFFFHYSGNC